MHCALSSLVLPFLGQEDIPRASDNRCVCQGLLAAEGGLSAWYPSSACQQRVRKLSLHPQHDQLGRRRSRTATGAEERGAVYIGVTELHARARAGHLQRPLALLS